MSIVVAAHCSRCSRFWFNLVGGPDYVLRQVDGYAKVKYKVTPDGQVVSAYPPNSSLVRVSPFAGPDKDEKPMRIFDVEVQRKEYVRYRVVCHPRCGADSPSGERTTRTFRVRTLAVKFAEAVEAGHADTRL